MLLLIAAELMKEVRKLQPPPGLSVKELQTLPYFLFFIFIFLINPSNKKPPK